MEQTEQTEVQEPNVITIPFLSDDDIKKLTYVNNLLLQEIISLIKEETNVAVQQKQV